MKHILGMKHYLRIVSDMIDAKLLAFSFLDIFPFFSYCLPLRDISSLPCFHGNICSYTVVKLPTTKGISPWYIAIGLVFDKKLDALRKGCGVCICVCASEPVVSSVYSIF